MQSLEQRYEINKQVFALVTNELIETVINGAYSDISKIDWAALGSLNYINNKLIDIFETLEETKANDLRSMLNGNYDEEVALQNNIDGNRVLKIDNEFETSIADFITNNTTEDVEPITKEEIEQIRALKVGDYVYIGSCKIERII